MNDIEKQHEFLLHYKIDSIELGELCEKYPGLKNSWEQFKIIFEMCKNKDNESIN